MRTLSVSFLALAAACTPAHAPAATAPAPIAWQSFGPDAFARAKAEHKLVMVDAGIESDLVDGNEILRDGTGGPGCNVAEQRRAGRRSVRRPQFGAVNFVVGREV